MHKAAVFPFLFAGFGAVLLAQNPPRQPRPGVKTPGVKSPIERLKPDAVFQVGGTPDWLAIDEHVWVSNKPTDSVSRFDPKTNQVVATYQLGAGKRPCSGLAAGFGSVWVPNCGDQTISRVDLKSGEVTATIKSGVGNSEGSIAVGACRYRLKSGGSSLPWKISSRSSR